MTGVGSGTKESLNQEELGRRRQEQFDASCKEVGEAALRFASRLTSGHLQEAEDLVSEAFCRVLPRCTSQQAVPKSLMFKTVQNCYYSHWSRSRRRRARLGAGRPEGTTTPLDEDGERVVVVAEDRLEVRRALATLTAGQREAFELSVLGELTYAQVAEVMRKSEEQVRGLIERARRTLRTRLRLAQVDLSTLPEPCAETYLGRLESYVDRALPDAEYEEVRTHLASCESCQAVATAFKEEGRRLRGIVPPFLALGAIRETVQRSLDASGFWEGQPVSFARRVTQRLDAVRVATRGRHAVAAAVVATSVAALPVVDRLNVPVLERTVIPAIDATPLAGALVTATPGPRAEINPLALQFGEHDVGSEQALSSTITVTNAGGRALSVAAATLTGDDADDFKVDPTGCAGQPVQPSAKCTIAVEFTPSSPGRRVATLRIPQGGDDVPGEVVLAGTGTVPALDGLWRVRWELDSHSGILGLDHEVEEEWAFVRDPTCLERPCGYFARVQTAARTFDLEFRPDNDGSYTANMPNARGGNCVRPDTGTIVAEDYYSYDFGYRLRPISSIGDGSERSAVGVELELDHIGRAIDPSRNPPGETCPDQARATYLATGERLQ